jgi:hypothetical protein
MEFTLRRRLTPEKGGRPPKGTPAAKQRVFAFAQE